MGTKGLWAAICLIFVTSIMSLGGCASKISQSEMTPILYIELPEPNKISFEGKGAGAGAMLSSVMGATGIAIGFAIDEGISKDIDEQFLANGNSLELMLKKTISGYDLVFVHADEDRLPRLEIIKYGYKITGPDDQVSPYIRSDFIRNENEVGSVEELLIEYSESKINLEQAKSNSELVQKQFIDLLVLLKAAI